MKTVFGICSVEFVLSRTFACNSGIVFKVNAIDDSTIKNIEIRASIYLK